MKKVIILLLVFSITEILYAQEPISHLLPCGTPPYLSPWLVRHQSAPESYRGGGDTVLWIPHTVHLLGTDEGLGFFSLSKTVDALCTLNGDYEASGIQYFLASDLHYISNSAWDSHSHVNQGYEMMLANDVPGTMNSYIVQDPAGNCGYNLPYGSLTVSKSCASASDHTWAHEAGHFFSLPHPFFGWEGIDYDYNSPTPLTVVNDKYTFFQDTVVWDTTASILDTNYVELMDYSNCTIAADLFCDTRPDYLSYRWPCGADNFSNALQKDPNEVLFNSDGTLYMSYSYDNCKSRFSDEQISAMRANIFDEYPEFITGYEPLPIIESTTSLPVTPLPEDVVDPVGVYLEWTPTADASHYIVQLTRFSSFSVVEIELLATGTSVIVPELFENKTYRWRVRPFNYNSFCTTPNDISTFQTGDLNTATNHIAETGSSIVYPSAVRAGSPVFIKSDVENKTPRKVLLYDIHGRELIQMMSIPGEEPTVISTANLTGGIYFVAIQNTDGQIDVCKIIIL